jgi:hypothetical protein
MLGSSRHGVAVLAVLTLFGCSPGATETRTVDRSDTTPPDPGAAAQPLLTHEVHVPEGRAAFIRKYAETTGLEARVEGGVVKVGPILSFFEASWLAGLCPEGKAVRKEAYDEPASPVPFIKLREAGGRTPAYVGTRRAAGERFALVTWERDQDQTEQELYQTHATGPRFLAKLPRQAGLDISSGLLFTKVGEEGTLLQVMNHRRDGAVKSEHLVAWRFALGTREVLFDVPFFSLELPSPPPPPPPQQETASAAYATHPARDSGRRGSDHQLHGPPPPARGLEGCLTGAQRLERGAVEGQGPSGSGRADRGEADRRALELARVRRRRYFVT